MALRRDIGSILASGSGYAMAGVFWVVLVPIVLVSGARQDPIGIAIFSFVFVGALLIAVNGLTSFVRLEESELVEGSLIWRRRWPRDEAVSVDRGPVPLLGGTVEGLAVTLADGREVPLRPTALMGRRRKQRWRARITAWIEERATTS